MKEGTLNIPVFYDTVRTLGQTVEVDYYLPGCPPPVAIIVKALDAILKGELPPKGSVLAPLPAVCDQCSRKRENKRDLRIHRVHEIIPDPERCLMEQGMKFCMGWLPAADAGRSASRWTCPAQAAAERRPTSPIWALE